MLNGVNYIFKGFQIITAGVEAYETAQNPNATNEDKILAAVNVAFAGLQIGDMIVGNISATSKTIKLGSSVLIGCLDIGRTGTQTYFSYKKKGKDWTKKDTIKAVASCAGVLCFRVSDITGIARGVSDSRGQEVCDQICKFSNLIGNIGMATSTAIMLPSTIERTKKVVAAYRKNRNAQEAQPPSGKVPLRNGTPAAEREKAQAESSSDQISMSQTDSSNLEKDKKDLEDLLRYSAGLDDLKKIPDVIADDERLALYRCPITEWPVRFAITLNLTNQQLDDYPELRTLVYERDEIEKRLRENPNEKPSRWPVTLMPLPLKREYFITDRRLQVDINRVLQTIIEELQLECLESGLSKKEQ